MFLQARMHRRLEVRPLNSKLRQQAAGKAASSGWEVQLLGWGECHELLDSQLGLLAIVQDVVHLSKS